MGLQKLFHISGIIFVLIGLIRGQEDSLRSALNAVDRRQKEFMDYPNTGYEDDTSNDYASQLENFDDLEFIPDRLGNNAGLLLDYLEDNPEGNDVRKRISSAFRERLAEDKKHQMEEAVQNLLLNSYSEQDNDDSYPSSVFYENYRKYPSIYNYQGSYSNQDIKKRSYYPKFGYDSIGLRKRNKYYEPEEYSYVSNYIPNYDKGDKNDDDNYYRRDRKYNTRMYNYRLKRFPVSKRSNSPDIHHTIHEYKRSTKKQSAIKTDPKVVKELSNIFGSGETEKAEKPVNKTKTQKTQEMKNHPKKENEKKKQKTDKAKEEVLEIPNEEPLQIKKKSVNWSDYFGLDRRKKLEDDLDNEWLMERFHKAIAMTSKRNAEYPLNSFKNHDQIAENSEKKPNDTRLKDLTLEETKISEMDSKLKVIEDSVIDDAIKFTGAHEGTYDSREIQEVKDRVISRLAAAYSLEKMRRALGEYKLSVAKEKERLKNQRKNEEEHTFSEVKRVSIPRKQAIDEDNDKVLEADNKIKCAQDNEDCEELNYRTTSNKSDEELFEGCPKVQRACNEIASVIGEYERAFEIACNIHQMCLLCNNNNWFAPTRQCNILFLTKAYQLCEGKRECQREMQRSVKYLLDVNRSLRSEPLGECELSCADRR